MSRKRGSLPDIKTMRFNFDVSPAVRFAGEFASIMDGGSFTTKLERGILSVADEIKHQGRDWRYYWELADGSPATAWVAMLAEKSLPLSIAFHKTQSLILAHEPFFFATRGKEKIPLQRNIEVLWQYLQTNTLQDAWEKWRSIDPWKVGEQMASILKKARITPPEWGPTRKSE